MEEAIELAVAAYNEATGEKPVSMPEEFAFREGFEEGWTARETHDLGGLSEKERLEAVAAATMIRADREADNIATDDLVQALESQAEFWRTKYAETIGIDVRNMPQGAVHLG